MAQRWHPNDRRKIRRSLEIFLQTGRKPSSIYADQAARRVGPGHTNASGAQHHSEYDGAPVNDSDSEEPSARLLNYSGSTGLRFPTLLLRPHVPRLILNSRLDARVDNMLTTGLLNEAQTLYDFATSLSGRLDHPIDESRGIYVAVGYKEFKPYLNALSSTSTNMASNNAERHNHQPSLETLKEDGIETTKAATRRYAKTQVRWLRNKLANALADANAKADALSTTTLPPVSYTHLTLPTKRIV